MLTPSTAANPSWVHDPSPQSGGPATRMGREFRRPLALALLILAALGWLAAVFSLWRQPDAQERQRTTTVEHSEDQERILSEVKIAQQKLATAQSALSMTLRLRDESAQGLQEVRERSAGVRKDLAAARDQLKGIEQKITIRNAELTTISKRLDTARLRESQEKPKEKPSPKPVATATPAIAATVTGTPRESPAAAPKAPAIARSSPSTAASPPASARGATASITPVAVEPVAGRARSSERHSSPIAQPKLSDNASPAVPTTNSSAEPSPAPAPVSRAAKSPVEDRPVAVIGPGDFSSPSKFELNSGRVTRMP
jgi:hypothetical protein